ncbi:porin [Vibrio vulnificus]|uniref:porin n=1 Tax=Vibrio vulnificus TaxID=672 RepID=UPI00092CAFCF|nr:porin [Vibrio vulnificus]EIU7745324.1 porin [Vibrio vulnificus]EJN6715137.1 porin [Vibrio vulnificus]EJQ9991084.1 porin [Vibrio vulnificus]EJV9412993.1 porin [Vibrio vulnificus]ELV8652393.1 porin [Vibrio vulnificus]
MKKTVLAVALSLVAGSAIAADVNQNVSERARESMIDLILSGEEFSVGGQVAIGGYYAQTPALVKQENEFYNGGVTGFDLFINYQKGNVIGQFAGEFDLADNYSSMDAKFTVIDTWVGYKTAFGVASIGYANDSALDAVDGAADLTIEYGASASDASDVNQVIKFEGMKEGFKYGISYYGDREANASGQRGFNGYVGFKNEQFQVNAGYEKNDEKNHKPDGDLVEQLYLVNGVVTLGELAIGANVAQHDTFNSDDFILYSASVGYTIDKLYLAAGYAAKDYDHSASKESVNFGGSYQFTNKLSALVDFNIDLSDNNTSDDLAAFFKVAYDF